MNMVSVLFWILITAIIGGITGAFAIGYYCGREDTADPSTWDRPKPGTHPYPTDEAADDTWQRLEAAWADDPEPETFGGLLEAEHTARHKRLADTAELRALAYAGDMDTINHEVDAFKAELDAEES
jgi:hypothetical protein